MCCLPLAMSAENNYPRSCMSLQLFQGRTPCRKQASGLYVAQKRQLLSCCDDCSRSGGVQGGISNGEDIVVRVAFKPTATIARNQRTVSRDGRDIELRARGRHDPCVVSYVIPLLPVTAVPLHWLLLLKSHLLAQI